MAQKKKKNNKYVPLVALLVALVALFAVYKALSSSNDRKEAEEAALEAAENADIMIAEYDYTTMTALSYRRNGEDKLDFLVSGSSWVYKDDENFPLDQTTVAKMASAIAQIAVKCTVDEGEAADYGLDEPAYEISVKYSDGTKCEYKIGNYNSFNSAYYFMADGDMYMIASGLLSYFNYTLDDLMVLDTVPYSDWSDTSYVNFVTVKNGDEENKLEDEGAIEALVDIVSSLSTSSCVDYYTEDEEKAQYGLDGSCGVSINYKKAKTSTDADGNETTVYLDTGYSVEIGESNGEYYFMLQGSSITYPLDSETAEEILSYLDYTPESTDSSEAEDSSDDLSDDVSDGGEG